MMKHAKLSPSSAKKWLNCPASVDMEALHPYQTSLYAEEGTTAHSLAELKVALHFAMINEDEYKEKVALLNKDSQMEKYTDSYMDFIVEEFNGMGHTTLSLETKIDLSEYAPKCFGTADCILMTDDVCHIIDFKYGKGVRVYAEQNPQLMLYALGVLAQYDMIYDLKTVRMTVHQPRLDHIDTLEMTATDLYAWGEIIKPKATEAFYKGGACNVGSWCDEGFCRAKVTCNAYAKHITDLETFVDIEPQHLKDDEIGVILAKVKVISKYAELIKDYVSKKLIQGDRVKGYKLVQGTPRRQIKHDVSEVCEVLSNYFQVPSETFIQAKLKGITELESEYGAENLRNAIGNYITLSDPAPIVVPISDTRPAYQSIDQATSENVIQDYLYEIRSTWADEDFIIVRSLQIESRILALDSVKDIMHTEINGESGNITLLWDEIPILGGVFHFD